MKDQISRLLQGSSGNPGLPGFPEQLEAGLRASQLAGGSTIDAQGLQRLVQSSQDGADVVGGKNRVAPCGEPEEIVFLPLETPVWNLESEQKGTSAMMVTQAENVEWMRMIWGRLTEPTPIMEAVAKQQQQEEEEKRKADTERARLLETEQQQQQLSMLNHLMQVLGSGNSLPQQQLAGLPPGIKQLLESQAPEGLYKTNTSNTSSMNSLLSMLGAQTAGKPPLPQSLSVASAIPAASLSQGDKSDVHRELEMAFGRAYGLPSAPSPTLSSLGAPSRSGHHRKGSLESLNLFDGGLLSPRVTNSQGAPIPPPAAFGAKSQSETPHVRASLTPGTMSPGQGPFIVVSADSRIQLTGTGFYLAVASGPHAGFEEALAAMTAAAHSHTPVRKDAEMVHVLSDTPIWHSLDLMHKPMMIVKAESLLTPPSRLDDDGPAKSTPADLLLESLKHNPAALLQQQVLSGATKQVTAAPTADQPAWAGQQGSKNAALPPLSDQLALLGALTSQTPSASAPLEGLVPARVKPEPCGADLPGKTQPNATTSMPPPPPQCMKTTTPSKPAATPRSAVPLQSDDPPASSPRAVGSEAAEKAPVSTPEAATVSAVKRPPSNLSLYPNKKAHILGRQQSLSPKTGKVDKTDEEAKHGKSCTSDDESGEQDKAPSTEEAADRVADEPGTAPVEETSPVDSEKGSEPPADTDAALD